MQIQKHLTVHGLVEGVGYRWTMTQVAERLGVRGWVRNRLDGTVEALAIGEAIAVNSLIQWARQGPPGAHVQRVELVESNPTVDTDRGFVQQTTA